MHGNRQGRGFRHASRRLGRNRAGGAFGAGLPTGAGDMGYDLGDEFGYDFGAGAAPRAGTGAGGETPFRPEDGMDREGGAALPGRAGRLEEGRVPGARQGSDQGL